MPSKTRLILVDRDLPHVLPLLTMTAPNRKRLELAMKEFGGLL